MDDAEDTDFSEIIFEMQDYTGEGDLAENPELFPEGKNEENSDYIDFPEISQTEEIGEQYDYSDFQLTFQKE